MRWNSSRASSCQLHHRFSLMCAPSLVAQTLPPRTPREVRAVPLQGAFKLDGRLDDPIWQIAPPATGLRQSHPIGTGVKAGDPATQRTEVRFAFDDAAIYVGARLYDDSGAAGVRTRLARRDADVSSDYIQVIFDTYHDHIGRLFFWVNPSGVKQDANGLGGGGDPSWDPVWEVKTNIDSLGWTAEMRIPFSQLRYPETSEEQTWGLQIWRQENRLNELSQWAWWGLEETGGPPRFGHLHGLLIRHAPGRAEVMPYVVGRSANVPGNQSDPFFDPHALDGRVGGDATLRVTSNLTLNATVNPDFGQVEADPAVVNLSAFETFFNERRPFFVESSGTYRFDINCFDGPCTGLFYSRRLGRQPRGQPDLPDGAFSVQPLQSTIAGAGKLTGRVGAFSVGALTAVTQEERAQIAIGSTRRTQIVEPRTFYSVARARREFANQSSLGLMVTSTNRDLVPDVSFLPGSAVTGGVDYDWRLGRRWSLTGYWAGSTVRGSAESITDLQENSVHSFQRPDAKHVELDPLATTLNGHAGLVSFSKIAGEHVRLNTQVGYRSPGFEINDLGYLRRADERTHVNWFQWRSDRPGRYVRSFNVNFNEFGSHNFAGERLFVGVNINAHWTFQNFWSTGAGLSMAWRGLDDRAPRGGPAAYANGRIAQWMYLDTNTRRPASFHWFSAWTNDSFGTLFVELSPRVQLRPTSSLSAELGVRWTSNNDDSQWVEKVDTLNGPHYVFGRLKQTTVSTTTRLNYTIGPNLSVQLYGEPFASAGHY